MHTHLGMIRPRGDQQDVFCYRSQKHTGVHKMHIICDCTQEKGCFGGFAKFAFLVSLERTSNTLQHGEKSVLITYSIPKLHTN